MSGNVWEWCLNEYNNLETNTSSTEVRGVRGGSWSNDVDDARAAYRGDGWFPIISRDDQGFRVVAAAPVSV